MFIDETWTKTNMAPLRGWAPLGKRLVAKVPWGHWNTTTFIAALRVDRIEAPWLLDGPMNGESFRTYVEHELVPTLKPGDIVIADNLSSHKSKPARTAIRDAGARLILLPDRAGLCQTQARRSRDAVSDAIAELLRSYTPGECIEGFTAARPVSKLSRRRSRNDEAAAASAA